MSEKLSKEEWRRWQEVPGTRDLFQGLRERRDAILKAWSCAQFTSPTAEGTAQLNAEALGRVQQLNEIINFEYEDLYGEE